MRKEDQPYTAEDFAGQVWTFSQTVADVDPQWLLVLRPQSPQSAIRSRFPIVSFGNLRQSMLTPDMRAVLDAARLGFVATVTPDGRPNLSPKGTIRVWDDAHLFFLDIASPGTRANLAQSPWMEVNVVDQLSRRGYRFSGSATLHFQSSELYEEAMRRTYGDAPRIYPTTAVALLAIEHAAPLFSPAYWAGSDEAGLRETWKERRAALDRDFESYLTAAGTLGPQGEFASTRRLDW